MVKKCIKERIPDKVKYIISTIESHGFRAYLVGGCVRDMLLRVEPNDWDICTSATPKDMFSIFKGNKIITTGLKYGTVTVVIDDEEFEITTFRGDGDYSDFRRPDTVKFSTSLYEDLNRRDFTINAMAYSIYEGLIDPLNGLSDLDKGVIKCVGNPYDRFKEDPLRILRALRFAARLGFTIEDETSAALLGRRHMLLLISNERLQKELCGILMSNCCGNTILREYESVIRVFIPEIKYMVGFAQNNPHHTYDVWEHVLHCMDYDNLDNRADIVVRLAVLLHDIGKPRCYSQDENGVGHFYGHAKESARIAVNILKNLRVSNEVKEDVIELINNHSVRFEPNRACIRRLLCRLGEKQLRRLLLLREFDIYGQNRDVTAWAEKKARLVGVYPILDSIIADGECFKLSDLDINGKDIMALGVPEGKEVGVILNKLLGQVVDGTIENEKDVLISEVEKIIHVVQ